MEQIVIEIKGKKVLAPEYGGDGDIVGRCAEFDDPLIGFPGHWAPNDLVFYEGDQFPERYKHGAFIAFMCVFPFEHIKAYFT